MRYSIRRPFGVAKDPTQGSAEAQQKVKRATSHWPWGSDAPRDSELVDISQRTHNKSESSTICITLSGRLGDLGKKWQHVSKALVVLDHCLLYGSEDVTSYFIDHIDEIERLASFHHPKDARVEEDVHRRAKDICDRLRDRNHLRRQYSETAWRTLASRDGSNVSIGRPAGPELDGLLEIDQETLQRSNSCRTVIEASDKVLSWEERETDDKGLLVIHLEPTTDLDLGSSSVLSGTSTSELDNAPEASLRSCLEFAALVDLRLDSFNISKSGTPLPKTDTIELILGYPRVVRSTWNRFEILFSGSNYPLPRACEPVIDSLKKLYDLMITVTHTVLADSYLNRQLLSIPSEKVQTLLDLLQDVLDLSHSTMDPTLRNLIRKTIIRLSQKFGLHPRCLIVDDLELLGEYATTGGSFADVWRGKVSSRLVAVKILRVYDKSNRETLLREFLKEAIIWGQLDDPCLLPFYGMYQLSDGRLCMLSPWMENGNVVDYLKRHPDVDRSVLCHDVAHGTAFLHEGKIVHGDLKGLNILIAPTGRPCISDFGLCTLVESKAHVWSSSKPPKGGTPRWQAPELFMDKPNTFESDVYAMGMVFYEILTDEVPYGRAFNDAAVMFKVLGGVLPDRIPGCPNLTDEWWSIITSCWAKDPAERPKADAVLQQVHTSMDFSRCCPAPVWDDNNFTEIRACKQEYPLRPSLKDVERILRAKTAVSGRFLSESVED